MLRGSLKGMFPKDHPALKDSFFTKRPEQLSVAEFIALTNIIDQANNQ